MNDRIKFGPDSEEVDKIDYSFVTLPLIVLELIIKGDEENVSRLRRKFAQSIRQYFPTVNDIVSKDFPEFPGE